MGLVIKEVFLSPKKEIPLIEVQVFHTTNQVWYVCQSIIIRCCASIQAPNVKESVEVKADERTWGCCLIPEFINHESNPVLVSINFNFMPFVV